MQSITTNVWKLFFSLVSKEALVKHSLEDHHIKITFEIDDYFASCYLGIVTLLLLGGWTTH